MALKKTIVPGLVLSILLAVTAFLISGVITNLGSALIALLLGLVVGNMPFNKSSFNTGIKFSEKYVLEAAIVLMGFGFRLSSLKSIGYSTPLFIVLLVVITMGISTFIGVRFMKIPKKTALLIGAGSAICGSAAIGAMAPIVKAKEEQTGISLAVINVLGLLGMVVLPFIAIALSYTDAQSALLLGGTLQSMGHVVGSGFSVSRQVGDLSVIVKMFRIVLLVPLLALLVFSGRKQGEKWSTGFPWFILLFILTVVLAQLKFISKEVLHYLAEAGDLLLLIAMAAIGSKIQLKSILKVSAPAFLLGAVIFSIQIILIMLVIGLVKAL